MRNPLHRKKLQLALQAIGSEQVDDPGQLDYNWVTRWLDDIGLPQYKDAFSEARIDGRMLHYLSVVSSITTSQSHVALSSPHSVRHLSHNITKKYNLVTLYFLK